MKKITLLPIFVTVILSCQTKTRKTNANLSIVQSETKSVIQPIKGIEIKPEIYFVDASKKSTIDLPTGSKVEFPANAFVDEKGKPVKGKVKIKWNEFHTLTDILLSGIPMKYDTAGVKEDLVSGGMFSISAEQNNKEVQLAKGKLANVDIASINDTPCMNFYQLDEKSGKWDYQTTKVAEKIEAKGEPIKEEKEDYTIFDVSLKTDPFPELANKTIVGWKSIQPISKKDKRKVYRNNNKCSLTKANDGKNYNLNLVSNSDILTVLVEPYFLEDALKNTSKIDKEIQKDYKKLLAYQDKMEKRITKRSISIKGFGTYNWDICHQADRVQIVAQVEIDNGMDLKYASIFLLTPEDNCIVKYGTEDLNQFSYNPTKKNCLIAIMPDNSVYSCTRNEFNEVKKARDKFKFKLINSGVTLKEGNDLTECLKDLI